MPRRGWQDFPPTPKIHYQKLSFLPKTLSRADPVDSTKFIPFGLFDRLSPSLSFFFLRFAALRPLDFRHMGVGSLDGNWMRKATQSGPRWS